jgi:hypothetical protein
MKLTGHFKQEWAPDSGMFESAIAEELSVCILAYVCVGACIAILQQSAMEKPRLKSDKMDKWTS